MTNKAETSKEMYANIQAITLFALAIMDLAADDQYIGDTIKAYGITEERIQAVRDFYTSTDFKIAEDND